jgi:hypothetical protein
MERRGFLTRVSAGFVGLAAHGAVSGGRRPGSAPEADGRVDSVAGVALPVPEAELAIARPTDYIPAITEPRFADDWAGLTVSVYNNLNQPVDIEPRLTPEDPVIGLTRGGEARAYPLRVLNWHEIVNDDLGGPLLVTYCPLCASAVTARRVVDGEPTVFGVSGKLWNSDLVMYDRATESLWSQIAGTAIRGPQTGEVLSLVPSRLTTWDTWQTDHPDTVVMLPPPESGTIRSRAARNYENENPYLMYASIPQVGIGQNDLPDHGADLAVKDTVLGVRAGGAARAYPADRVRGRGLINDAVGGVPVVVAVAADGETLVAYDRRVGGTTLAFERTSDTTVAAGGSTWQLTTGEAVSGPHEGTTLAEPDRVAQLFWFAWLDFNPETSVFAGD